MNAISGNRPDRSTLQVNLLSGISIGIISAAVIFLQIVFMRSLSITRYHHFSYLIMSSALLGFGASGTFLSFFSDRMKKRFEMSSSLFILLFLVSTPLCYAVAERIPLDINYILYSGKTA